VQGAVAETKRERSEGEDANAASAPAANDGEIAGAVVEDAESEAAVGTSSEHGSDTDLENLPYLTIKLKTCQEKLDGLKKVINDPATSREDRWNAESSQSDERKLLRKLQQEFADKCDLEVQQNLKKQAEQRRKPLECKSDIESE
jgi:hypothetical protein